MLYTMFLSQECKGPCLILEAALARHKQKDHRQKKGKDKVACNFTKSYVCSELNSIQGIKEMVCGNSKEMFSKGCG